MEYVVFASCLSFVVAFLTTPVVIKIADAKKLFDRPSEHKVHFTPIPTFGGVAFFVAVLFSVILLVSFKSAPEMQYFVAASIVVFLIGLKDDILLISPIKKFLGQLLAVFLLTYQGHFQLTTLQGLLGIYELNTVVAAIFTYLTVLVIVNAFNLIDGVDGLAGMMGIITGLFFGCSFMFAGDMPYAILAFSLVFSLMGFLVYNFSPARVFMGDTGSLFLGLVISVLAIRFINTDYHVLAELSITQTGAMAFAAVFIPIMDTLRVFSIRIYKGLSPFSRDVNHIHHLLLNKGYTHVKVTIILVALSLANLLLAYSLQPLGINVMVGALMVSGILTAWICSINRNKPNQKENHKILATSNKRQTLSQQRLDKSLT
jgi:UDP-N-acetylmuramyl pentapeptide phosphotransferase/UDP-N-acetylglucosamine-1-phosphate transferase